MPKGTGWLWLSLVALMSVCAPSFAKARLSDMVKQVSPAIVTVTAYDSDGKAISEAGGFLIDASSVITYSRAVDGAAKIKVETSGGQSLGVTGVSAVNRKSGVAHLALSSPYTRVSPLQVSENFPYQGEKVFVLKCPPRTKCTTWEGIVTTVREFPGTEHVIQFSGTIKENVAGNPLVNTRGQVVGIVRSDLNKRAGINFAAPGEQLLAVKAQAISQTAQTSKGAGSGSGPMVVLVNPLSKGLALSEAGEYQQALEYLNQAVKVDPGNHSAWFAVGHTYFMLNRFPEAITAFKRAIAIKPDFESAYVGLGYALSANGMQAEAETVLKQAIQLAPDDAYAHYGLGGVYIQSKRKMAAMGEYETLKKLDPNLAGSLLDLIAN